MADETTETTQSEETTAVAPATADIASKVTGRKKKGKAKVSKGKIFITSSYNNTIISATDISGNVLTWSSAGKVGFKGTKKSTPYAGQKAMEDALQKMKERGFQEADVFIKGIGSGRESAVRALQSSGLTILTIKDQTPTAHGGVRPKKVRRV